MYVGLEAPEITGWWLVYGSLENGKWKMYNAKWQALALDEALMRIFAPIPAPAKCDTQCRKVLHVGFTQMMAQSHSHRPSSVEYSKPFIATITIHICMYSTDRRLDLINNDDGDDPVPVAFRRQMEVKVECISICHKLWLWLWQCSSWPNHW